MQNFIGDFLAVVIWEKYLWGEKFWVELGRTPSETELEPFSGYSKPNLERKVVLRIEIL